VSVELLAWRRAVSDLYAVVRASTPEVGHDVWRRGRDDLFRTSSQSPLRPEDPRRTTGLPVTPYDPSWRCEVPLEPAAPLRRTLDGGVSMTRTGVLRTPWGPLDAWWLDEYSGGLFVPVKDRSAGRTSYGAGRYLLDSAKGADLGGDVVVDLYVLDPPSCAYDPAWSCPLAPEGNVLETEVTAGEVLSS
jgi:uncharacterized protein (DUF1684 family)